MLDDLLAIFREEGIELEAQFRRASIQGKGTSQEVADYREHAVQALVQRFFPYPHRVTKGKIRDSFGGVSASVDCIVCNPNHPYTVDTQGKFTLLLAEGIDAAIEVKPNLADSKELTTGLAQGLSVKALKRANSPTIMQEAWIREHFSRVPFGIFAMSCKANPIDTLREVTDFYRDRKTPVLQQADFIAVNGVGIFRNLLHPKFLYGTMNIPEGTEWVLEEWGENTLAGFVLCMQQLAHASIKMQEDVLPMYIDRVGLSVRWR
jgi:hypothetical protein